MHAFKLNIKLETGDSSCHLFNLNNDFWNISQKWSDSLQWLNIKFFYNQHAFKCSFYSSVLKKDLIQLSSKGCIYIYIDIEKPGFNNTWTMNFQMFKLNLQKAKEQQSNCQQQLYRRKRKRVPEKHLLLLYWLCQSLWLCGSQQTVENSSSDRNTRVTYLPPEKSTYRSRSNS